MKQAQKVITRFPIESYLRPGNIKRLSDLINDVYDDAESGMWKRQGTRTSWLIPRAVATHGKLSNSTAGLVTGRGGCLLGILLRPGQSPVPLLPSSWRRRTGHVP